MKRTTRKPVTVAGTKANRKGVLTTIVTNRKSNPISVEIAFTSSLATRKAEKYFWITGKTEQECLEGLAEQFSLTIV